MQIKDLPPLIALVANLFALIFSVMPIVFLMGDIYASLAFASIFAFILSLILLSFYSQFHSKLVSTIFLLLSAITFLLLSIVINILLFFGLLNVAGFFLNLKRTSRPKIKKKHLLILLIFLLMIPPFLSYPYEVKAEGPIRLQFFAKPEDIPENVQILRGIDIALGIGPSALNDNTAKVVERLNENGINVHATLVVDQSKGIYAHDKNSGSFIKHYNSFRKWVENHDLEFDGVLIDSESDSRFFHRLALAREDMDLFEMGRLLISQRDDSIHEKAIENYSKLIGTIKDDGYQATLIAMPQVADDSLDGDDFLQRVMGVASIPPSKWDKEIFMIYRSTYEDTIGSNPGSYLIYSYGRSIQNNFPRGSVAIGVAGRFEEPMYRLEHRTYLTVDELSKDLKILNSLGFSKVHIFSLGTFLNTFGERGLKRMETTGKVNFEYDWRVSFLRGGPMIVDRLAHLSI